MAKEGDRVRFLNSTGGGVIRRIEGKTAYVEDEDGFESPILLKDVVVVMPAGHESAIKGSSIMFDQKAYDAGKTTDTSKTPQTSSLRAGRDHDLDAPTSAETPEEKPEETKHGDVPSILLAFEPDNLKNLSNTKFAGVLVNDSNFYIDFTFLKRSATDRGWELVFKGTVNPNELIDVVVVTHEDLPDYGKIALQGIAYKKDKPFPLFPPLNVTRRLDLTKFHKLHCFRESKYFDSSVLEFPLLSAGETVAQTEIDTEKLEASLKGDNSKELAKELAKKYKTSSADKKSGPATSPFKKLPLIEVDLHIGELTDTLAGMEPKDMLEMQLAEVRKTMEAHSRRIGQKIVFIHGKGEGVLRKAVIDLLKKEYPKAELQDASFREYGFGATLVTIH
ncbi:MAG: DUF2027 domain-containing protein [Muribaculaceae bacterium]|nr:DUF2027 domain-containing protein [Muribaculaceae bacterium]